MELLAVSAAIGAGLSWQRLAALWAIVAFPLLAAAGILAFVLRYRSRGEDTGATFCDAVAAEVRAGASLLHAIGAAGASLGKVELRDTVASGSLTDVSEVLRHEFRDIGNELATTVRVVSAAGPRTADLFDEIGSFALALDEVRAEVRVATAPARTTALILVGAPLAYLTYKLATSGVGGLVGSGSQALVGIVGLSLFVVGLGVAMLLAWRSV